MKNCLKIGVRLILAAVVTCFFSCSFETSSSDSPDVPKKSGGPSILKFVAEGEDSKITTKWAVSNFTSDYSLTLIDGWDEIPKDSEGKEITQNVEQSREEILLENSQREKTFEGLINSEVANSQKTPVYTYTLILKDKDGNALEKKYAQATPAPSSFEYSFDEDGNVSQQGAWVFVLRPDFGDHAMAKT